MTIIFYDIPSTVGPWSPNTWKVRLVCSSLMVSSQRLISLLIRYCLNLKKIPYKTEWIEYPDIAAHCEKLGIAGSGKTPGKSGYYTLPAIHDPATGVYLADSPRIAEYLEAQYPGTPHIFPHGTIGLQIDFEDSTDAQLAALWSFVIPPVWNILNPASQGYFRETREKAWGVPFDDIVPVGEIRAEKWAKVEAGFAAISVWYSKSDEGPFIMGKEVSWADFVMGAHLLWFNRAWGDDNPLWKAVIEGNGGVWKKLFNALKEYETIN